MSWRKGCALGLGLDLLLIVVNKAVEYSLLETNISWKQVVSSRNVGYLTFLPFLVRGFRPTLSAILGLSGLTTFLMVSFWNTARTSLWFPHSRWSLPPCWLPDILLECLPTPTVELTSDLQNYEIISRCFKLLNLWHCVTDK